MKNRHVEKLRRKMREYHRHHQWRLEDGLYIPHKYPDEDREQLSWWDDAGFILNGRRVIVHWVHPRCVYSDAIEEKALSEIVAPVDDTSSLFDGKKTYRKLGRSRKKVAWVEHEFTQEQSNHLAAVKSRDKELRRNGIDLSITPSMRVSWYTWAMAVYLVAPLEVRSHEQVKELISVARRLLKRQTTIEREWPDFSYGPADWLSEANARSQ